MEIMQQSKTSILCMIFRNLWTNLMVKKVHCIQVEITASLHECPDPFIFQTAKSNLEGAAKFWFVSESEEL